LKLVRFSDTPGGPERLGALVPRGEGEALVDLRDAAAARQDPRSATLPPTMTAMIAAGDAGLDAARDVAQWAAARDDGPWLRAGDDIHWLTPVPPRACFAAGRNFGAHRLESERGAANAGSGSHAEFPTGFIKLGRTLVPHKARVQRPVDVVQFDYEVEVAMIVGRPLARASRAECARAIFGYTVFNDLSAREWQKKEMQNHTLLLGKNFPGFGPLGPCILTADEVPDPAALVLWLKVNGELRQHSDCRDLIFGFAELLEFWSRTGLEPGDIVAIGTPEGVAMHRRPDPAPFYLKPGDVVHAGVDPIGVLETRIV
jgi:2-keto-4-pentenoate hydratase/2-oxohepta-3-ene-1,7-dioic acid hydratase in catechol pathway